ncbi:MAG TPA: glycosyltransferase family 4 protein [Caulobacteraceae bacterium]|nr:glycosyltransferase family 4 protein [Caulobacteraceae bacterium]
MARSRQRFRTAIIDDTLPPNFTLLQVLPALDGGGVEQAALDLARCAADAGARSLIACRGGALEDRLPKIGAELVRLPLAAKDPLSIAANGVRLARLIRRQRVSLVHVRSRAPAFSALIAARITGAPLAATYHGAYRAGWFGKRWVNRIMTAGDIVFANSEFIAGHIAAEHPRAAAKIVLAREGVDLKRFDVAAVGAGRVEALGRSWGAEARKTVLIAARLSPTKGQQLALAALARMTATQRPLLVLAGMAADARHRARLETLAGELDVADQVRFVGALTDMPAAYLAADIIAAPSTVPESFGRAVVEAAAMGRPAIASDLGALAETIVDGETGWLVRSCEAQAWAGALEAALAAPATSLAAMGKAARDRARRLYPLEGLCAATFAAYRRLVDRRG